METLADRARRVVERVRAAERRAGRSDRSVTLCAVSKTFPASAVVEAAEAGLSDLGENRVQEAEGKRPESERLGATGLRWHLIGHLQSNKARKAVETFEVIQTVDTLALLDRIDRVAGEVSRRPSVYVQVDLGHEPTKTGAVESDLAAIVERARSAGHLDLVGLMTIPPFFDDPEDARPYFRRLRELGEQHGIAGLSMGMSHDFEVAIEEGATLVRVGTAIFGHR